MSDKMAMLLKKAFIEKRIDECAEILDSLRVPVNGESRAIDSGDTPYYGANGLQGYISGYIFDEPLILIAEDGGYFEQFETRPIAYRIFGKSWVNNHAHVLRARENVDFNFLFYSLEHKNIVPFIKGGTRAKLNQFELRGIKIQIPSSKIHQQKIATILTSIDTAIEKTEALIEKYQQIKSGLMHDLFTRGVLPNGQLRPTREQAPELYQETKIGWIPREWGVHKLGTLAHIVSGVTLGASHRPDENIQAPYLRVANVQDGYLDLSEIKTIMVSKKAFEYLKLKQGDVLMNEGGDYDKLGRGAVWENEIEGCIHQNHVFRVRTNKETLSHYFLAFFTESNFGKKYFLLNSKQSTNLASINSTQLHAYPVLLPDLEEQLRIEERISSIKRRINTLKNENKKYARKKLGLMQDLLTGKVPVTVSENADKENAHA